MSFMTVRGAHMKIVLIGNICQIIFLEVARIFAFFVPLLQYLALNNIFLRKERGLHILIK